MTDPRVEAARSALDDPLTMLGIDPSECPEHGGPGTGEVLARAAVRAADAADLLLPKMCALWLAANEVRLLPRRASAREALGNAVLAFTDDDLRRLSVIEPVKP